MVFMTSINAPLVSLHFIFSKSQMLFRFNMSKHPEPPLLRYNMENTLYVHFSITLKHFMLWLNLTDLRARLYETTI